jgi:hypothetical protein
MEDRSMASEAYDEGYEDGHTQGLEAGRNREFGGCDAQRLRGMDVDYRTGFMDGYDVGNREAEDALSSTAGGV